MGWTKAPDTSRQDAVAEGQLRLANENAAVAREQIAYQREQDARYAPMFDRIISANIESQATADERSKEQWDNYMRVFAPTEERLATQALGYDTPTRRGEAAAEAVAGVDAQFDRSRQQRMRDLGRAGISLDSGRAMTLNMAESFARAKAAAGADRQARQQVEITGMNLVDNAAKLGRGLAGTSLQAQGLGLSAGQAGTGAIGSQGAFHNAGMGAAQGFYGGALSGFSGAGSTYANIAQQQAQARQASASALGGLGSLAGTLATAGTGSVFGSMLGLSDPDTKKVHGKVSGKKALADIKNAEVYDWTYKEGKGDGGRHIGRMAGAGDVETPDGKAIDVISELGTHHAAIKQLAADVAKLKKGKRSLSDVKDVSHREVA